MKKSKNDWSDFKMVVTKNIQQQKDLDEKKSHPIQYCFKKLIRIILFPILYPVIIIDNIIKKLHRKK